MRLTIISKTEKAIQLGISSKTLDRWIKENKIDYIEFDPKNKRTKKWFLDNYGTES